MITGESYPSGDTPEHRSGLIQLLFEDLVRTIGPDVILDLVGSFEQSVIDGRDGAVGFPTAENQHVIAVRSDGFVHVQYGSGDYLERFRLSLDEARELTETAASKERARTSET